MLNRDLIGQSLGIRTITVEAGRIRFFSKVIGETNPIYFDEAAAQAAGHRSLPVPPTFLFCLESDAFDSVGSAKLTGANAGRMLHGEQQFDYLGPICAGDTLTFDVKVVDIYEKKNGALDFLVRETRITNQHGEHVANLRSIGVQKNL